MSRGRGVQTTFRRVGCRTAATDPNVYGAPPMITNLRRRRVSVLLKVCTPKLFEPFAFRCSTSVAKTALAVPLRLPSQSSREDALDKR